MRLLSLLCGLLLMLGQAEAKVRPYEDMVASGVPRSRADHAALLDTVR